MDAQRFRFGVAVGLIPDSTTFVDTARRIEQLGYSSLVMADGLWLPAPFTALSAAGAATSTLRLGTHVLAVPCMPAAAIARETETIDMLSDQRFELGLGTGAQPATAADAQRLGLAFGSRAERVRQVADAIAEVRQVFAAKERPAPKIVLAGVGRALARLAATEADTLALPVPYDRSEEGLAAAVGKLRTDVGAGFDKLELAANLLIVGDKELPSWVPAQFRELPADSHGRLSGTPAEIADTLRRRRDETGISYVTVPQWSMDTFAPVVERLSGT